MRLRKKKQHLTEDDLAQLEYIIGRAYDDGATKVNLVAAQVPLETHNKHRKQFVKMNYGHLLEALQKAGVRAVGVSKEKQ